jgi:hypothetical protein
MRVMQKLLAGLVVLVLAYGVLLGVERMTRQELTSVPHPESQQTVCLMWQPRFLTGNGVGLLDLKNATGKVIDSVQVGTLDTAFNALQQWGQVDFQGDGVKVSNLKTGEVMRKFAVRDGKFRAAD